MTYLGGSVAALAADRNTWKANANTAYDSGTWGVGNHWHTNANTAYQSGTWGAGNTWHYNADQAWGASRSYGAGESWEAAYNRVLPPASVVEATASAGQYLYSGIQAFCSVAVPRTGYYFVVCQVVSVTVSAGVLLTLLWNGSYAGDQYNWNPPTNNERVGTLICATSRLITAGQSITFRGDAGGTAARTDLHTLRAVFVPTQAYPH